MFLALVVACGGSATVGDTTGQTTTTSAAVEGPTSTIVPGSSTTTTPGSNSTTSGRQIAPDFTLELGDGGQYVLSEGAKPVYLVFWAEW